jgi:hypothetical protein
MDELEDHLNKLLATIGSDRECWNRVDAFVATHRPKGKRSRKQRGITNFGIKYLALEAYENAPPKKKTAAELAIYRKFGIEITAGHAKTNRKRLLKELRADVAPILPELLRKKGDT